ncbi:MAG: polyprenyl synthetase family protein [Candidatus Caenarcaniphilales bacterium]|nr:polyprenyl synthetase family protein [Candidatus Caenarcaniphilales bacterium]
MKLSESSVSNFSENPSKGSHRYSSVISQLNEFEDSLIVQLPQKAGVLKDIISYILSKGGKRIRPTLVFLCSGLLESDSTDKKPQLIAEITELIHTASLVHDDLIDDAANRRGKETTHLKWNSKVAIIAGDFLFAQASVKLGELQDTEVVRIYANVLSELCIGEINQAQNKFELNALTWENYFAKSYSKTASLFEAASKSPAIVSNQSAETVKSLSEYGKNLGLAFQIIDDLLDFTSSSEELGKPSMGDLANGTFTAPILFALEDPSTKKQLEELIQRRFQGIKDLEQTKEILASNGSFNKTHELAQSFIKKANDSLNHFPSSIFKDDLQKLGEFIIERKL